MKYDCHCKERSDGAIHNTYKKEMDSHFGTGSLLGMTE